MQIIGWVVLVESYIWKDDDDQSDVISRIKSSLPEQFSNEVIQCHWLNGLPIMLLAMGHNHHGPRTEEFIDIFRTIARMAPGSYGQLHLYDEEGRFAPYDAMTVYVLARGEVHKYKDPYFNPFIPNVERPFPNESSPTPVSERVENPLPFGTVVTLNGSDRKLMIIDHPEQGSEDEKSFDYAGRFYSEENTTSKTTFLFNHADIAWIHYGGYVDDYETV
jgi:hypothetical protein